MSWWHKIGAESDEDPPVHAPGRSVYEDRDATAPTKIVVGAANGRLVDRSATLVGIQCERYHCL